MSPKLRMIFKAAPPPAAAGSVRAMEGAMLRANLWNDSVSRVELDQRARDARLRLERHRTTVGDACRGDVFPAQAGSSVFLRSAYNTASGDLADPGGR